MKRIIAAVIMLMSLKSQAQLLSTRYSYIHHETHARLELTKIDQDRQTAQYYDLKEGKTRTVNLSDVSRETNEEIEGVRVTNMVLVRFANGQLRPCEVWYLYSNGLSHVGCQSGKIRKEALIDRPIVAPYTASVDSMVREVNGQDGFEKKDKVRLMKDVGDLRKGDLVRIEHIFQNGSAMIQKMGANLIDTSGLLMKSRVQVVDLKDLTLNK